MPCSRSCLTQTLPPTPSCAAASWRRSAPRSTSGSVTATLPAEKTSRSRWRTRWFGRTRARRCRPSWPRRTKDALVDGELYRFHEAGSHTYASFVGPLEVERPTFRKVGVRNGPTVVPLDLAAGLLHGTTPALAWRIARGAAKRSRMAHGRARSRALRLGMGGVGRPLPRDGTPLGRRRGDGG